MTSQSAENTGSCLSDENLCCCVIVASRCYIFAMAPKTVFFGFVWSRVCFYGGAFLCPKFRKKTKKQEKCRKIPVRHSFV